MNIRRSYFVDLVISPASEQAIDVLASASNPGTASYEKENKEEIVPETTKYR
jgi:hypothetical protein